MAVKEKSTSIAPIEKKGRTVLTMAQSFEIACAEDAERGVEALKQIKEMTKSVDAFFAPQIESAHKTHKILCDKKKEVIAPLQEAERLIKGKKTLWDMEQNRIAEAKRNAAALEAEEEERKLKAALEKKLAKAKTPEQEALIREQIDEVHVHVESVEEAPAVNGVVTQKTYDVEVTDLRKLCKSIGDGELNVDPAAVFTVKLGAIKNHCKMTGCSSIPGCRVTLSLIQRII